MTADDPLFQAILDDPDDDGVRLVYADYLEEHGEPERAEFIRVQIELARLPEGDPRRPALEKRERAVLERHEDEWVGPLRPRLGEWSFDRGMLEVAVSVAEFLSHAEALSRFPSAPFIHLYGRSVGRENIAALAASPFLARVCTLALGGWYGYDREDDLLDDEQAALLASSPYVTGLKWLELRCNTLGDAGVQALASSDPLSALRGLDLRANRFGDGGLLALSAAARLSQLVSLDLSYLDGPVSERGWRGLARSPNLPRLRWLYLAGNNLSDATKEALVARFGTCVEF
jgi:uncharacterized protein (TIGR02996 family)